ncbi:permease [Clostridium celatum]|uniref:Permease n=1 Tax=Clostridium celatum DSM 1785 TaxID=545697 RepID=L1QID6_9CLOT|nr:permease [Clostridium celatum]EKY27435.1 hypothetical protein HMPREF0216_01384 [Clostridium celatum DSM 1785]
MKTLVNVIKRYKVFILLVFVLILLFIFKSEFAFNTISNAKSSFIQMLSVLPPIMLLLGLMDAWVPRETLIKFMGDQSGFIGILLAMLIGSIAAGPMYASFPFTAILIKKGAKFSNVLIFMTAWCLTKVSTLLFEFSSLGYKFTLVRLFIDIPGVILMSYFITLLMGKESINKIYTK